VSFFKALERNFGDDEPFLEVFESSERSVADEEANVLCGCPPRPCSIMMLL
jgi:hypothetical protein